MSANRSRDSNDERRLRVGARAPALLALTGALLITGVAAWWLRDSDGGDQPSTGSHAPEYRSVPPVVGDAPDDSEPDLPVALPPESVESLAPSQDSVAIRGGWRVLSMWGRPPDADRRASCTLIVIDWQDRPVPGALVHVWGDESVDRSPQGHHGKRVPDPIGPFDSTTDALGRCTVQLPAFGPRLYVEKDGVGESARVKMAPSGGKDQYREILVPLRPLARLTGHVVQADGRPARGAVVRFQTFTANPGFMKTITSDQDGRFELPVPSLEQCLVRLEIAGEDTRWHSVNLQPGEEGEVLLRQPGPFAIRGSLVDAAGLPFVPEDPIWVQFWPDAELTADIEGFKGARLHEKTDDSGRFEITLDRPARGLLTAWGEIPGLTEPPLVEVDADHPQAEVVLRVAESASIEGLVLDEAGAPLAGFNVWARADDPAGRTTLAAGSRPERGHLFAGSDAVTTDRGEFVLTGLHPQGVYSVRASKESSGPLLVVRGVEPGRRDLVLACGTAAEQSDAIVLVVTDGDTAERCSDFDIEVFERAKAGGWLDKRSISSEGSSGLATVGRLRAGSRYDLLISAKGLACAYIERIEATAEDAVLQVTLPALATLAIDVTVDGKPVPWPTLVAEREMGMQERREHRHGTKRGRGLESGRVEVKDLEPGRYTLVVGQGGRETLERIELAAGETRTLAVELE